MSHWTVSSSLLLSSTSESLSTKVALVITSLILLWSLSTMTDNRSSSPSQSLKVLRLWLRLRLVLNQLPSGSQSSSLWLACLARIFDYLVPSPVSSPNSFILIDVISPLISGLAIEIYIYSMSIMILTLHLAEVIFRTIFTSGIIWFTFTFFKIIIVLFVSKAINILR